jgi:hypothetical protein
MIHHRDTENAEKTGDETANVRLYVLIKNQDELTVILYRSLAIISVD